MAGLPGRAQSLLEIRKVPYYDRVGKRHGLMGLVATLPSVSGIRMRLNGPAAQNDVYLHHQSRIAYTAERYRGLSRILLDTELTAEQEKYLRPSMFRPSRWGISLTILSTW